MYIESWLVGILIVIFGGIEILTLVHAMCLDDKLEQAHRRNSRLENIIGDYKEEVERLNRKLLVKKVNEVVEEMGKK